METDDVFGHDPQVVYLRRVFSTCEKMEKEFLTRLGINEIDVRLRKVRKIALDYFERALPVAMRKGTVDSAEGAGILYVHCFSKSLGMNNISVPPDVHAPNDTMSAIMKEALG